MKPKNEREAYLDRKEQKWLEDQKRKTLEKNKDDIQPLPCYARYMKTAVEQLMELSDEELCELFPFAKDDICGTSSDTIQPKPEQSNEG